MSGTSPDPSFEKLLDCWDQAKRLTMRTGKPTKLIVTSRDTIHGMVPDVRLCTCPDHEDDHTAPCIGGEIARRL